MNDRRFALALALLVAFVLSLPALLPRAALANTFYDDAYYYFVIARHLIDTGSFTFDGLHATNGYQPLWLFAIVPLFAVFHDIDAPVRAVVVLQALISGGTAYVIARTLTARIGRAPAGIAAATVVALPTLHLVVASGMESALLLFFLVCIWRQYLTRTETNGLTALGILCALSFWTRPESLVAPAVIAVALYRQRRLDRRRALQLIIPIVIALVGYFLFNELTSGIALPISGLIKSNGEISRRLGGGTVWERLIGSIPAFPLAWAIAAPHPQLASALAWLLIVAASAAAIVYRRRLRRAIDDAGVGLPLVICALFWVAQTALLKITAPWYGVWLVLATALGLGALTAGRRWAPLVFYAFVLAALARGALHTRRSWRATQLMEADVIDAAVWMKQQLRPNERVGSWNAGLFAYYCGCTVVNLDGLVNDVAFYRQAIVARGLVAYLRQQQIHWLADDILSVDSFARPSFGLTTDQLAQQPMTLVRSFCAAGDPTCGGFGVWRTTD